MGNEVNWQSFGSFENSGDGGYKLPICLVLDKSGSMGDREKGIVKIDELNKNVLNFINFVKNDSKAKRICDLCIIAFGGEQPEIVSGYTNVEKIVYKPLVAEGRTPMGAAVTMSIDLLEKRRTYYKSAGIEHYKPIMLLMSDGEPTDRYEVAAQQMSDLVKSKRVKIFPVGIGNNYNHQKLASFSPELPPKRINDVQGFMKLFDLLSRSSSVPTDDSIDRWFKETV